MKFKKILKWELFAGLTVILVINFLLLNLLVNTIFKNAIDRELDNRLGIIGESLESQIDAAAFLLSPEDRYTPYYTKYLSVLDAVKRTWSLDVSLMDRSGRTCVTTRPGYNFFDSYFIKGAEDYSITYFEGGEPVKNYVHRFQKGGELAGYIMMELRGKPLAFFGEIRNLQAGIMFWLFVFALVIAFIFSFLITRRIEYTVREMEIIAKGDMQRQIKVDWFDEFSYLQDRINKMVRDIREIQESRYKEVQIVAMGLAHEIKNPAAAVYALAELAQRNRIDEAAAEKITQIKAEVTRLNLIVEKFIHFAREMEPQKNSVKITDFTAILTEQFTALKTELKDPGYVIGMDEVLMERAFKNIIKNAYEAGAKTVEVKAAKENDAYVFMISDDAPLIAPEVRDKIWIPFFTTKQEGMGIGLAITKNIIEKHKGSVEYRVEEGRNCFKIILPI